MVNMSMYYITYGFLKSFMMLFSITVFAFVIRVQNTLWRQIIELTCPFKITHLLSVLPEASLYSRDSSEGGTSSAEGVGIHTCCRQGRGETHSCPRDWLCLGLTFKPLKLLLVSLSSALHKFEQLMELGGGVGEESGFFALPLISSLALVMPFDLFNWLKACYESQ